MGSPLICNVGRGGWRLHISYFSLYYKYLAAFVDTETVCVPYYIWEDSGCPNLIWHSQPVSRPCSAALETLFSRGEMWSITSLSDGSVSEVGRSKLFLVQRQGRVNNLSMGSQWPTVKIASTGELKENSPISLSKMIHILFQNNALRWSHFSDPDNRKYKDTEYEIWVGRGRSIKINRKIRWVWDYKERV